MGRINEAVRRGLGTALLLIAANAFAEPESGTIKGVKFPEYSDSGELKYMVYSEVAHPRGVEIDMQGVVVDYVKDGTSVDKIADNRNVELYTVDESAKQSPKVEAFWEKYVYSKAFCRTPKAKYDRVNQLISGDGEVFLRTPQMDIDGFGFFMDQQKNEITIKDDVVVVLRDKDSQEDSSKKGDAVSDDKPSSALGSVFDGGSSDKPKKPTKITSEQLVYTSDMAVYTENVVLISTDLTIHCERMELHFKDVAVESGGTKRELDTILCFNTVDGESLSETDKQVIIIRNLTDAQKADRGEQRALCGKAEYKVVSGKIVLTESPVLIQDVNEVQGDIITIWKNSDKMNVKGNVKTRFYDGD